ncbi:hypothetical protein RRG08_059042 [Elysia crispata]|uniref:Uncharacterized protein n=1 Tax=Elysia crispata TaxID=231223 RepID=A0AAE0ZFL3_9GAST|nr:hypothetical protein RRG08_059042 [Elysia crispata]
MFSTRMMQSGLTRDDYSSFTGGEVRRVRGCPQLDKIPVGKTNTPDGHKAGHVFCYYCLGRVSGSAWDLILPKGPHAGKKNIARRVISSDKNGPKSSPSTVTSKERGQPHHLTQYDILLTHLTLPGWGHQQDPIRCPSSRIYRSLSSYSKQKRLIYLTPNNKTTRQSRGSVPPLSGLVSCRNEHATLSRFTSNRLDNNSEKRLSAAAAVERVPRRTNLKSIKRPEDTAQLRLHREYPLTGRLRAGTNSRPHPPPTPLFLQHLVASVKHSAWATTAAQAERPLRQMRKVLQVIKPEADSSKWMPHGAEEIQANETAAGLLRPREHNVDLHGSSRE